MTSQLSCKAKTSPPAKLNHHMLCAELPTGVQLRNLVWATSKHDVFLLHEGCIRHWNALAPAHAPLREVAPCCAQYACGLVMWPMRRAHLLQASQVQRTPLCLGQAGGG